ncbi:hypothetical protein FBU30_007931 [Linnemannia zychae]|nr:hypothetical protein FBU30_007931 [Linnemannia zychae]
MGAQWKREIVQDHKFDFINVDDFIDSSCWRQFTYSLVFAAIIRGILVYCSDIFTAANLLANSNENSFVPPQGVQLQVFGKLPYEVYKWLFSGCILLGFALLGWEIRRARAIIISRDISHAFTSLIASRYYTVRSYPHYCFFAQINNSKKLVDDVAFFCFFTFRNWKRLILADAPRQIINATILYQTFHKHLDSSFFDWDHIVGQGNNFIYKKISLGAMMFTVFMFALSLIMLISAAIMYIPLVSHIRGNLKEFCCHKIDKRIGELIKKKSRTRAADEAEKAAKDPTLINTKQPTLPRVEPLDEPSLSVSGTPRMAYAQNSPLPYGMQTPKSGYNYIQQPPTLPYMHSNNSNVSSGSNHVGHGGYGGGGASGIHAQNPYGYDYYQTKSVPSGIGMGPVPGKPNDAFDPYAESAFTGDDVYGGIYGRDQGQPYIAPQSQTQGRDGYDGGSGMYAHAGGVGSPITYFSSSSNITGSPPYSGQTPPRARRYDDYFPERSGSPIPSQCGSDLDSHHGGSVIGGYSGGGGYSVVGRGQAGGYRYAGQNVGGTSYGSEYQPINPRRQESAATRNMYHYGGGGPGY